MFDYGWHSWGLNPDDEPEHEYIVHYEEIGGIEAKLLLPTSESTNDNASYGAATGVYSGDLNDGYALNLVGRGLTPGEQRVAVAIFRSVRALE